MTFLEWVAENKGFSAFVLTFFGLVILPWIITAIKGKK